MRRHVSPCPVWVDPSADPALLCRCPPPPWRVRKTSTPGDQYPWRIERWITADSYELFMRADAFDKAIAMVSSITTLRYRSAYDR